ncbi:MAG: hypothetical protein HY381_02045 [Candidatus Chisholmbacteria bacterium]|nr:hypothetical protein [Candidatus Chisholmbacteria bacterium]
MRWVALLGVVVVARTAMAAANLGSGGSYFLPDPGILPDHPLYWLKVVRDRVGLWLTTEPVARAERLLVYADRRMSEALSLSESGQGELAVVTAQRAEEYLARAVRQAEEVAQQGRKVEDIVGSLVGASLKHQEVLETIRGMVPAFAVRIEGISEVYSREYRRIVERWGN